MGNFSHSIKKIWPLVILIPLLSVVVIIFNRNFVYYIVFGIVGITISLFILTKPYIGIALILASLIIIDTLPEVPFVSSASVLLGGITLIGYLLHPKEGIIHKKRTVNLGLFLLLILIFWIVITNPKAAVLGQNRLWIITLIQLWILAWLGGNLVDKPYKNWWVFVLVIIAADISAIASLTNGVIGSTIYDSIRSGGLSEGINTAARYYVLAILFTYYVFSSRKKPTKWTILFCIGSLIVLFLGLASTLSRTGFALLPVLAGLIIFQPNSENKTKLLYFLWGIGILFILVPDNALIIAGSNILPSILQGTDTLGTRYRIWEAGLKIFLDYPITGVGIGQFFLYVHNYGISGIPNYSNLSTHNLYIQLLSETGIVGTLIFLSAIFVAIKTALRKVYLSKNMINSIDWIWLSVLVIILVGGFSKSDFADKFIWIALGILFRQSGNISLPQKPQPDFAKAQIRK